MGGDGPHYSPSTGPLHRNSSFGLATFRADGFVAVRAKPTSEAETKAKATTVPVRGDGAQLLVTADTDRDGAGMSLRVQPVAADAEPVVCQPLSGRNVTNEPLQGCDLRPLLGQNATLEVQLTGAAMLYTIGFRGSGGGVAGAGPSPSG